MFKRVRWIGLGTALGVSGSIWAQVKVRRAARRYLPAEIAARAADRARDLRRDVSGAVSEGRQAMQERETELRARLDPAARGPAGEVRDASSRPVGRPEGSRGAGGPPSTSGRSGAAGRTWRADGRPRHTRPR